VGVCLDEVDCLDIDVPQGSARKRKRDMFGETEMCGETGDKP
jgi:hypothetical protein